jgi:hypothetical protein
MINLKTKRPAGEHFANKTAWVEGRGNDYILVTDDEDLMQTTCNNMEKCTHYQKELTDRNYTAFPKVLTTEGFEYLDPQLRI